MYITFDILGGQGFGGLFEIVTDGVVRYFAFFCNSGVRYLQVVANSTNILEGTMRK